MLASTHEHAQPDAAPSDDADSLIEAVRGAGVDVLVYDEGEPRPLAPDLEAVAFRVMQEMLTNVLRHADRGQPVVVTRHWADELRLQVINSTDQAVIDTGGIGLEGMHRRLEAVGGRLEVQRHPHPQGSARQVHVTTAWLPVSAREVRG